MTSNLGKCANELRQAAEHFNKCLDAVKDCGLTPVIDIADKKIVVRRIFTNEVTEY